MNSRSLPPATRRTLLRVIAFLALAGVFGAQSLQAQTTPGGTQIHNSASATYSDGDGNDFATVSNTVTVTVANVSGLNISPDGGSRPSVVGGQNGVAFTFTVTNTGNFDDQVRFLAGGQSLQPISGPGTIAAAFIDANNNGTYEAGTDVDIFTNAADVVSPNLTALTGSLTVVVLVNVNAGATNGQSIVVRLGDAASDNAAADTSANEVRTVSGSSVNGLREASGDVTAQVENDAQLRLTLNAPAGPVALGSDINYTWEVCNVGARDTQSVTLTNAPGGSNTGVFIIAPIPVGTALTAGQTFPAGTLYTTSALSTNPLTAVWTTAPPANLADVRRVAFNVGATLAVGACSPSIQMLVTVTTTDATNPIWEIGDTFGSNSINTTITDQSGDNVANAGDGNANFDEGAQAGNVDGNGVQQQTLLQASGAVLIGPLGQPGATGPTNQNDDYTNRSVNTGIAGVSFGNPTTAPGTVVFSNTVQNTGNANDTFVLTAQTVPAGFTVEISIDGGANYTPVAQGSGSVNLPLNFSQSQNILVRITAPAGIAVLNGYDTVLRATSTLTGTSSNDTINRLYTGFLRVDKAATVTNGTGVGGASDAVPGAEIEYVITYTNISSSGGAGNATLTASNIVITEDGNAAPNNWGTTTDQVVGSASDTRGGAITGDAAGSSLLTDTVPSLAPGQSGVFRFRRVIR